jgi:hypothetical protein
LVQAPLDMSSDEKKMLSIRQKLGPIAQQFYSRFVVQGEPGGIAALRRDGIDAFLPRTLSYTEQNLAFTTPAASGNVSGQHSTNCVGRAARDGQFAKFAFSKKSDVLAVR